MTWRLYYFTFANPALTPHTPPFHLPTPSYTPYTLLTPSLQLQMTCFDDLASVLLHICQPGHNTDDLVNRIVIFLINGLTGKVTSLLFILYSVQCTLYAVHLVVCTMYAVHLVVCTLYAVHLVVCTSCSLYNVRCTTCSLYIL